MAERGGTESRRVKTRALTEGDALDFAQVLAVADALPMGLAYVDREHRYRFINATLAEFFERPRAEILGERMESMLGESMAERAPHIEAAMAGKRQFFTADYEHPSRGTLCIQSDYLPQFHADGTLAGVVILVHDITEQRVAERALKESEARFRRIADSAPVMMWVTRLDRTRDFVNGAYADFTGLSREEAKVHDWHNSIHPDDVERLVAESVAGEASGEPFTLEARYRRHDGDYRWLRSVSQPRFGPDGDLLGFIGAATDVTIAKEAELELKEQVEARTSQLQASEARVRAIFETVMEVIVLLKPDGTIVEMNHVPMPWRSTEAGSALGKKVWEAPTLANNPELIPQIKAAVKAAATGAPFSSEVTIERPGGQPFALDFSIQPVIGADGQIEFLLAEARDVTELKAAQEQLRQSQKMEALGQLTGGIAHDFNNLLTVVVGGLDLIVKQVGDERLKRYATNALSAAERGARLTGQLLAFSRVQRLEVRPTLVAPLIEEMRPLLRNVLGPGIDKKFDLDPHLMPVMADPTQLEVAVLNLAINARDAMPDGGTLTISSSRVRVEDDAELEDGDYIELCIGDTGAGMPPEVLARAFEPFFTTKDVGKGTGLGLSMVYGMARQSGGTARIDSDEGAGTVVRMFFRRAEGEAVEDAVVSIEGDTMARDTDRKRVLVVDDDDDVRQFIAAALEEFGHEVVAVGDGPDALDAFASRRPDLVILDYLMPGMTGAQVAERLRADTPDQPILFVTGYSESEAILRAAPDAQVLAKPFLPDALDIAVRRALAEGRVGADGKISAD